MGERKVLNKYYPPDFDPAKLPRGKRPDHNSMKVRMMLPMSVQCKTCGTFMYKGTKFNMKKEDVDGDTYLGIQIFRFYWRCSACAAEITMLTDPKNADYNMELGATRNYEPWREKDKAVALSKAQREEEERGNAMKALENRTLDSRREMDIMTALDELQSLNARHNHVTPEAALAAIRRSGGVPEDELLDDDDEAIIRQMVQQSRTRRLDDAADLADPADPDRPPDPSQPSAAQQRQLLQHTLVQPEDEEGEGNDLGGAKAASSAPAEQAVSRAAPDGAAVPEHAAAKPAKPGNFAVRGAGARIQVVQKRPAAGVNGGPAAKAPRTASPTPAQPSSPAEGGLAGLGGYGGSGSEGSE